MTTALTTTRSITAFGDFIDTSLDDALLDAEDALKAQSNAIQLFHSVAQEVPAYRAFLNEHGIDPTTIRTFEAFQTLPLTDKQNYQSVIHSRISAEAAHSPTPTCWPSRQARPVSRQFGRAP